MKIHEIIKEATNQKKNSEWSFSKSELSGYQIEQAYWKRQSRLMESDGGIKFQPYAFLNEYIERSRTSNLWESHSIDELKEFQKYLLTLDKRKTVKLRIGSKISILQFTPLTAFDVIQVNGFLNPKTVKKINRNVDGNINWIEFTDGGYFPDKEFIHNGKGGEWEGITTLFFPDYNSADQALMLVILKEPIGWKISTSNLKKELTEASGYIPTKAQERDPRFSMALSVDVDPEIMPRQAKAMGLGKISRDGRPPILKSNGKFSG